MNLKAPILPLLLLVILFLVACGSSQLERDNQSTLTAVSRAATRTQSFEETETACLTFNAEITSTPRMTHTQLADLSGYIAYQHSEGGSIIDTNNKVENLLPNDLIPIYWSPSGKYLLLRNSQSLFVSDNLGNNPRLVYSADESSRIRIGYWLTDEIILVEVWLNQHDPHIYYIDVTTGDFHSSEPDYQRWIEAVSPNGSFWLQSVENPGRQSTLELADLDGTRDEITFGDLVFIKNPASYLDPNFAFLPSGNDVIFRACDKEPFISDSECEFYIMHLTTNEISHPRPIYKYEFLPSFRLSPDGRLLAIVEIQTSTLSIYNIEVKETEIVLPWNELGSPPDILWSPSSESIVFNSDENGLTVIDIATGEYTILETEFKPWRLWDWRL